MFTEQDLNLIQTSAYQATMSIRNMMQYMSVQNYSQSMMLLNQFVVQLSHDMNPIRIGNDVTAFLKTFFEFDLVLLNLMSFQALQNQTTFSSDCDLNFPNQFSVKDYWSQLSAQNYNPCFISPNQKTTLLTAIYDQYQMSQTVLIPFMNGKEIVAYALGFFKSAKSEEHIKSVLLRRFSQDVSAALVNVHLYSEMMEAKNYHETILQQLLAGVVICDSSFIITEFNQKMTHITGLDRCDVVGKPLSVLYKISDAFKVMERSFLNRKECAIEFEALVDNVMTSFSIVTDVLPVRSLRQDGEGIIGIVSDIQQLKGLQKQVEQANRLSSLVTMASGIAHEIKNPLVSIKTFTQLLPKRWQDLQYREKYMEIVDPQVDYINNLCQSLLELGKLRSVQLEEMSLMDVIEEVRMVVVAEQRRVGGEVVVNGSFETRVIADRRQMVQVFLNVILNGLQALNDSDGVVEISECQDHQLDGYVVVSIRDNGTGMPKGSIDKLFDPFFTTKNDRVGLGMTIIHKIMEEHKGEVSVHSDEGYGTIVRLTIPTVQLIPEKVLEMA